jgi:hypothetical protein
MNDMITDESEMMWKEAVITYFMVVFHNFPGATNKSTTTLVRVAGIRAEI